MFDMGSDEIKKVKKDWKGEYHGKKDPVPSLSFYECPDYGERAYDRDAMHRIEERSPVEPLFPRVSSLYSCFWDYPREFNISNASHQLERETRGYFPNEFLSSQQTWVTLLMAKIESCKGSEMGWKAGLSIGIREVSNRELNNDKFLYGCVSLNPIFGESPFVSYLRRKAAFRKLYFPTKNTYSELP
jgi:hypothetical protein